MDILSDIVAKSKPVISLQGINSIDFKKKYLNTKTPVVLKGHANEWVAKKRWNLDFFQEMESDKSVTVEKGNIFQKDDAEFLSNSFKKYIKSISDETKDKAYLSLFSIFNIFPELKNDVDFSIFTQYCKENFAYGWIGPKNTVTGLHWDSVNNMLAQIKGTKSVLIASPKYNKQMYPSKTYDRAAGVSEVNIDEFNELKYPKFKEVQFSHVILEPGDVLYIPGKWWHYVKSLETSISVNNFGYNLMDKIFTKNLEFIQNYLHYKGLYKSKSCTCHQIVNGVKVAKSFT